MSEAPQSFLKRIKQETQAEHDAIELNPLTSGIVHNTLNLGQYINLLQKFLGFYGPCESFIQTQGGDKKLQRLAQTRPKAPLLRHDLQVLEAPFEHLAIPPSLPPLQTPAEQLGYLYVVEGSTLGGQILYQALQNNLGLHEKKGASYFYGYGPQETAKQWRGFQSFLENFVGEHPEEEDALIQNARLTFKKLDEWLRY